MLSDIPPVAKRDTDRCPPPDASELLWDGMHFLIVEDDPPVRDLIERLIDKEGKEWTHCWAGSGRGALELLRTERIDAVILDLNLGQGISGRDVAHYMLLEAKNTGRTIPIVIITGDNQEREQILINPLQLAVCRIDKGPNFHNELLRTLRVLKAQTPTE
jgi:CheY-like chemotaxis protein